MAKKSDAQQAQPIELTQEELSQLEQQLTDLETELQQAKDAALRAQADYQNLLRRTREERSQLVKMASKQLVEDILEPLEHLSMVAEQSEDTVLPVVLQQLWAKLQDNGLQEIECMGKPFDVNTMEVIDREVDTPDDGGVVVSVAKRGYMLNGQVIQHAKVVLGLKKN